MGSIYEIDGGLSQAELFNRVGEICDTVNAVISKHDLLNISLDKIMSLFGASRGSIFILDKEGKELTLEAAKGMASDDENRITKQLGEGVVGKVAEMKKPIFVEDILSDSRFKEYKGQRGYSTNSFICSPLLVKDELIGVINITDKESGYKFKMEEIQLLDFLSAQIALNYRRIELYQKFKTLIKETQTLKNKLGKSDRETEYLKKQIYIQDKLATIGKLAGGIAHEFNNPLDGVLRYTNLCLKHVKDDDVMQGYLLEIKDGLNRMAGIVKNLLFCSRNELLKSEKANIEKVFDLSVGSVNMELSCKNITVEKNIPADLPPINDLGLERILVNLLRNAIDAMDNNGKIIFEAQFSDGKMLMYITDTGEGIPSDQVDKIFEPFYTTKDMDKGCGLGLTIVGEIVKSYNGSIEVESERGKKTTFKISLPVLDG